MAQITVDSHDFLGKLSIIKNCLALLKDDPNKANLLDIAFKSNQDLIDLIKNIVIKK